METFCHFKSRLWSSLTPPSSSIFGLQKLFFLLSRLPLLQIIFDANFDPSLQLIGKMSRIAHRGPIGSILQLWLSQTCDLPYIWRGIFQVALYLRFILEGIWILSGPALSVPISTKWDTVPTVLLRVHFLLEILYFTRGFSYLFLK